MRDTGKKWEQRAQRFLEAAGLRTLDRNFRARPGEIDLIMLDTDQVVFVEVRRRQPSRFVSAAMSVDCRKQQKICKTAMVFLQRHPDLAKHSCRFDVVAWEGDINDYGHPKWLRGAFTAN